jgi:hypothetical protein
MYMNALIVMMLIFMVMLSGCNGRNGWADLTKPVSLNVKAPPGPLSYRQGWSDGCESGLSAANDQVQLFLRTHQFTLNPRMKRNPLYFKAWTYAYNHCAFSMKSMLKYHYL